jgi:hypothetical protein
MLGKLIKHDFRALSRTLFPLQIGILAGGLVATLLTVLTIRLNGASATVHGSAMLEGTVTDRRCHCGICVRNAAFDLHALLQKLPQRRRLPYLYAAGFHE